MKSGLAALCLLLGCGETTQTLGKARAPASERSSSTNGTAAAAEHGGSLESRTASGSGNETPNGSNTASGTGTNSGSAANSATGSGGSAPGTTPRSPVGGGAAGAGAATATGPSITKGTGGVPAVVPGAAKQCSQSSSAVRRRLDMYLMVDTQITLPLVSGSGGWDNVRDGLSYYVSDACAAGVGVGVRYFGIDCEPASYATPTTPVAPLPDNADAIKRDIPVAAISLSTTIPALQGALMYSRARAKANPDSKQAIVLVSDGFVDYSCLGPAAIPDIFANVTPSSPSIPIYVLALDVANPSPNLAMLLEPVARFEPLEQIANGGGTGKALHIDLEAQASDFGSGMLSIQHDAQPCDFSMPDSARADPTNVMLGVLSGSGHNLVPVVSGASACGQGYYLDDPSDPHWAILCPDTCGKLNLSCASLDWVSGCR